MEILTSRFPRLRLVAAVVVLLLAAPAWPAVAARCGENGCGRTGDGKTAVGLSEARTAGLPGERAVPRKKGGGSRVVPVEYTVTDDCSYANPNHPGPTPDCGGSGYDQCAGRADADGVTALGPLSRVWYRALSPADRSTSAWQRGELTCFPEAVPGVSTPQLTMAMVTQQWSTTPVAEPGVSLQPDGPALVTKPSFVQVTWPVTGLRPDQVRAVTLLGHQVRIKAVLQTFTYSFGDGTTVKTTSPGGRWPDGNVRHGWEHAGTYTVGVSATYTGQFSVDGSEWADLPGATTVAGSTHQQRVVTLKTRLVIE